MIVGVIEDVARHILLGETPDPMFQAGRAGNRPRPRQGFGVSCVGLKISDIGLRGMLDRISLKRVDIGGCATVSELLGEVPVAQHDDGRHVFHGHSEGLEGGVKTVAGCRRGDDWNRALGVSAEENGQQVALFGLCRRAG